jgi:hypothetical protein
MKPGRPAGRLLVSAPHTSFAMSLSRDSIAGHVLRDFLVVSLNQYVLELANGR